MISKRASGFVERLPSGDEAKSPWPGACDAICIRDTMSESITESQIYKKLASKPRLVGMINREPQ